MEGVYISILLCLRRPGWLGSVNSSSSMGAPFSTMNATRTPSDGLLGEIRISRPASSEARSATSNATLGSLGAAWLWARKLPLQRKRGAPMEPMPDRPAWAPRFVTTEEASSFRCWLQEQPDRDGCQLRSGCEALRQHRRLSIALGCR